MHRVDDLAVPSHLRSVFVALFPGFEIDHVPNPIEVHHPIRPPQLTVSKVNGALREHFCGLRFKKLARVRPVEDGIDQGRDGGALIWSPEVGTLHAFLQARPIPCVLELTQQTMNRVPVLDGRPFAFGSKSCPMQLGTGNALAVRLSQREPLHVVHSHCLIICGPRFSVVCPKIVQHCRAVHAFGEGFLPPFPQQLREGLDGHVGRRWFVKFQSDVQPVHRPCRSHVGHIQSIQDGAVNFGLSFVVHDRVF